MSTSNSKMFCRQCQEEIAPHIIAYAVLCPRCHKEAVKQGVCIECLQPINSDAPPFATRCSTCYRKSLPIGRTEGYVPVPDRRKIEINRRGEKGFPEHVSPSEIRRSEGSWFRIPRCEICHRKLPATEEDTGEPQICYACTLGNSIKNQAPPPPSEKRCEECTKVLPKEFPSGFERCYTCMGKMIYQRKCSGCQCRMDYTMPLDLKMCYECFGKQYVKLDDTN
jgi:hypothetical protein